jgi:hypothetical protein
LQAPRELSTAIAASDEMKRTMMVISRKANIPYASAFGVELIAM